MAGTGIIEMDNETICLTGAGAPARQIRWADVTEVAAWKLDLFSHDLVCLAFLPTAGAYHVTFDESQEGWAALLHELERRFGLKAEDWWPAVVVPAFQENFTILWRR